MLFSCLYFSKAREELEHKSQRLTEVLTDYGDVVPRREFEKMEKQFQVMLPKTSMQESKDNALVLCFIVLYAPSHLYATKFGK